MVDKKKMLEDGYIKITKVLAIAKDINGKQHCMLFHSMEEAKKYTNEDVEKRQITLFEKIKKT